MALLSQQVFLLPKLAMATDELLLNRRRPCFPAEAFPMGFDEHEPVLEERAQRRRRRGARRKEGRGGPVMLLLDGGSLMDVLQENSFLLFDLLCGLGDLAAGGGLLVHGLDDADGHGLPHVAHGEATWEERGAAMRG
ncbi:hypothetical protein EYF80_037864 [Liparis tanakae]|uniref:Uncharacterized protein n=1 Tax=Liparis tanakae TaxID=230148 RepID=A0A4Z2GEM4_9TELE|nr:hypothetical protein EYF80_037864 [Liparis tanakae]